MLWDIAVEFSESSVRLATREKGLVFSAPSWGAVREGNGGRIIAIGDEALAMLGRTPPNVRLSKPLSGGTISDARLVSQWLKQLLQPFASRVSKPSVVFLDNGLMSAGEKELLTGAAVELGAGECGFLMADVAAASGAGLDIKRPDGIALIDAGAGTMSAALLSFGRVVCARRLPYGLDRINDTVVHLVREQTGLSIGPKTAEDLKLVLAGALPVRDISATVVGLDMKTGFPGERSVTASLIKPAVDPIVDSLALIIRETIAQTPGELSADLLTTGLILTGGGALLSGLDTVLASKCDLVCHRPEAPSLCTGKGMARIIQDQTLSDLCVRPAR